jgi:amicyanin
MATARRLHLPSPTILRTLVALAAAVAVVMVTLLFASGTRAGTSHSVDIADFAFSPQTLTIQVGDTVTWTNLDQVQHTATSTTGAFDTGLLDQNASSSVTFTDPGTYDYLCTPHPTMTGRIVVQAAPAATPAPSQATGGGGTIPDVAMPAPDSTGAAVPIGVALLVLAVVPAAFLLRRRTTD